MPSCPGGPWRPWRSWISPDPRGRSPPPFAGLPPAGRRCFPSAHTGADEGPEDRRGFACRRGTVPPLQVAHPGPHRRGPPSLKGIVPYFRRAKFEWHACNSRRAHWGPGCGKICTGGAVYGLRLSLPSQRYPVRDTSSAPVGAHLPLKGQAGRYDFMPFPLREAPSEARRMRSVWATLAVTRCSRREFWPACAMRPLRESGNASAPAVSS